MGIEKFILHSFHLARSTASFGSINVWKNVYNILHTELFIHKGIWNLLDISERIFSRVKVYYHASGDILLPTRHVTSSANIITLYLSKSMYHDSQ